MTKVPENEDVFPGLYSTLPAFILWVQDPEHAQMGAQSFLLTCWWSWKTPVCSPGGGINSLWEWSVRPFSCGRSPSGDPECSAAWLSVELLFPSVLPMPVELNSVSDSSRRHSPTKRIESINAGWGGVTWVFVGWSEAVGLKRMGQDDTWTLSPSEDYCGVEVCEDFFPELKETELWMRLRSNPRIL